MIGRGFKQPTYEIEQKGRTRAVHIRINGEYVMDGSTGKPADYLVRAGDAKQLKRTIEQLLRMA